LVARSHDLTVVGWIARYDDGSVYSSKQTSFKDLPDDGVLVITVYYAGGNAEGNHRRNTMHNSDVYFSDGDQLFGHNNDPIEETEARYPGRTLHFKRGRWTTAQAMKEALDAAILDHSLKA
jgi:hypothetical protein